MNKRSKLLQVGFDDQGYGHPVILLHAFPLNRHMWDTVAADLLETGRLRVLTYDWRGFGDSLSDDPILTMETYADDLADFMDERGIAQATLVGLSMGGYAAFAFLRKYPERILRLVLADTKPGADPEAVREAREQLAQLAENEGVAAVADLQLPRLLFEETRLHRPEVVQQVRSLIEAASPQSIAAASRGLAVRADSTDLLPQIICPSLVIVGEHDQLTPPTVAEDYARQIPGTIYRELPQAGHLANLEQPEAFLKALKPFLLDS